MEIFEHFGHTLGLPVVTTGPQGSPALDRLKYVCVSISVWSPNSRDMFQMRSYEGLVCCGFYFLVCVL